jgi:hypothetical protein
VSGLADDVYALTSLFELKPVQFALAREEMRLNEIERLTANFGTSEAAETRH